MTDKERLRRIWITLEYLFAWWPYLSDEEKLEIAGRALEDTRNHEQIEQLREKVNALPTRSVGESERKT